MRRKRCTLVFVDLHLIEQVSRALLESSVANLQLDGVVEIWTTQKPFRAGKALMAACVLRAEDLDAKLFAKRCRSTPCTPLIPVVREALKNVREWHDIVSIIVLSDSCRLKEELRSCRQIVSRLHCLQSFHVLSFDLPLSQGDVLLQHKAIDSTFAQIQGQDSRINKPCVPIVKVQPPFSLFAHEVK